MEPSKILGIHLGKRDESFTKLIKNILEKGQVPEKYINILTSKENMINYADAFTSKYIDYKNNYEVYEQLGDASCSKFIVSYFYTRFPQLVCDAGVKIIARLKINYGSKQTFSEIARNLGFWDFISETNQRRFDDEQTLLEDVFEAFIGITENLMDNIKFGLGYVCIYNILKSIFDNMEISLEYEDLYDAKTILKQAFDLKLGRDPYGKLEYTNTQVEKWVGYNDNGVVFGDTEEEVKNKSKRVEKRKITFTTLSNTMRNTVVPYGIITTAYGLTSKQAHQEVSKKALQIITLYGITINVPNEYREFKCDKKSDEINIKKFDLSNIDNQLFVKGQSKYYKEYTSTLLGFACSRRNCDVVKYCIERKANINETDTTGLYCADLLFIGSVLPKKVKKICSLLRGIIKIHSNVYESYFKQYESLDDYFKEFGKNLKIEN